MKIGIVGMGVAGSLVATALSDIDGVEWRGFEQTAASAQLTSGTGLNIGPNAVTALEAALPDVCAELKAASLPWRRWRASTVGGELLYEVPLREVAGADGLRIRWADLYRICRQRVTDRIEFDARCRHAGLDEASGLPFVGLARGGGERTSDTVRGLDLLVASEGRYSEVRRQLSGEAATLHLGVGNFRVLLRDGGRLPIDDLEQWFNGPARLIAFRLRDGSIYLSGNLPLLDGVELEEHHKTAGHVADSYTPADGSLAEVPRWLIDQACHAAEAGSLHWSRLQEASVCWQSGRGRVVYLGDAGHAMVPTLGQGATGAIEDAAVFVRLFRQAWTAGHGRIDVPALLERYEALRSPRVDFVRRFSWDASDVLRPDTFSLDCVRAKGGADYRARLTRLYDVSDSLG